MEKLVKNGVSPNIASFLGATNVRKLTVGYENRDATDVELKDMEQIVETGMKEGARYRSSLIMLLLIMLIQMN